MSSATGEWTKLSTNELCHQLIQTLWACFAFLFFFFFKCFLNATLGMKNQALSPKHTGTVHKMNTGSMIVNCNCCCNRLYCKSIHLMFNSRMEMFIVALRLLCEIKTIRGSKKLCLNVEEGGWFAQAIKGKVFFKVTIILSQMWKPKSLN